MGSTDCSTSRAARDFGWTDRYARRCASRYIVAAGGGHAGARPVTPDRAAPLSAVGEFELIKAITAGLPAGPGVLAGPGDDAALLEMGSPIAVSTDVLVEGVHF